MMWVMVDHLFVIRINAFNTNNLYVLTEWQHRIENSIYFAAHYAVDTFFCMSGILVTYVHMKYSEKFTIKLSSFYLFRLLRLVPALVATILIYVSVVKYVTQGPIWHSVLKQYLAHCKNTWWTTLLFVNNFIKYDDMCIQQTWYLSVDTQLYAVAPLILFFIKKNPTRTFLAIIMLCFVSMVYTWTITVVKDAGFVLFWDLNADDSLYVYFSTLSRMPAWLIGIVFGYFLYRNKNKKNSISQLANITLWLVSLCSMLALVLYQVVFVRHNYDVTRSAFFNSLSRPIWSLAVCSIIYSCCTGRGGCVNTFLSHPLFVVLGKLTYSMYLIHFLVIFVVVGNPKESTHFSTFEIFHDFCGIFVDILVCSFVICLVFETPVMLLIKYLFGRNTEIKRP
ncbi:nose resistant to fluoxetine protein 6-like [Tenebrio molitor]|uniref:nose resistant to fluoxetine protein 6-like n=1 Tax=Tenebrio molitor TaxID=7067 RepID=UPI003624752B